MSFKKMAVGCAQYQHTNQQHKRVGSTNFK
jgi:hypothetical protein